jgi:uncharacterized protein (TIGR02246 family)
MTINEGETEIRRMIVDLQDAICALDLDKIMSFYADEAVSFDIKPPMQLKGKAAIRQMWAECLPCFPKGGRIERRDIAAGSDGNVAYAHWHFQLIGMAPDPGMVMWLRATSVCRKSGGKWLVIHDHVSAPFDPMTSKVVMNLEP